MFPEDANLALIFTVLPCTVYEDTVLTRLVTTALIYSFGTMTGRLFKAGIYLRPGVYFMGENSIISQSTNNNKVIILLSLLWYVHSEKKEFYTDVSPIIFSLY